MVANWFDDNRAMATKWIQSAWDGEQAILGIYQFTHFVDKRKNLSIDEALAELQRVLPGYAVDVVGQCFRFRVMQDTPDMVPVGVAMCVLSAIVSLMVYGWLACLIWR